MFRFIKKNLITGILIWLPIWATFLVFRFLVKLMDGTLALIPKTYQPAVFFGQDIPGLGILFTLLLLFITGITTTYLLGHRMIALWESLLNKIPLIRTVYTAVKQVSHALIHPTGNGFRQVLLVEYPKAGVWSIGFQTADNFNALPDESDGLAVFIPTTPNPTSGFLVFVPKNKVKRLPISVEEGLKMVISLGVMMPTQIQIASKESNLE